MNSARYRQGPAGAGGACGAEAGYFFTITHTAWMMPGT